MKTDSTESGSIANLCYIRMPLSLRGAQTVLEGRQNVERVTRGDDDRLLVVVG